MSAISLGAGLGSFGPLDRLGPESIERPGLDGARFTNTRSSGSRPCGVHSPRAVGAGASGTLARSSAPLTVRRERDTPLSDCSDEALMSAYLSGDREAFVTLVNRYRGELHQFLTRFLGSAAAADDVFQETFLQVHVAGHSFDPARTFKPWLFTIAANKARDWHRRQKRRVTVSLDAPIGADSEGVRLVDLIHAEGSVPAAASQADELRAQVSGVVNALPHHYREILLLSYFQRMSYNQVAEVLGIPLGTVKSRLHAAVAAFADRWKSTKESDS